MSVDVEKDNASPNTTFGDQAAWDRVYAAVTNRWPAIDQLELLECKQSVNEIVAHVSARVDDHDNEVRSVVAEFAPPSPTVSTTVSGTAGDVIERLHYEIAEAPVKSSLTGVLIGFGLGVLATTLYSNASRKAEMRLRGWF